MIYDSNSPAPIKYTDPTFQPSLFVRALIIDNSGGSPVLAATVNLTQYLTSAVYLGKYTFTAGKPYTVISNVYTDGTYSTIDNTYPQDTFDVQCIDLRTAELDVAVSTRLSGAAYTAPDNTGITAIEVAVAAIPTDPLLTTDSRLNHLDADISSRLPTSSYVAPDNADISAIKTVTDQFNFTGGHVNAHCDNAGGGSTNIVGIEFDLELQNTQMDVQIPTNEVDFDLPQFEMDVEIAC